ncbi:hypothetical protein [Sphingomicrobium nitratireducens]|uniref:hypothetical protein n=1 Tax=Sphingomicrobium nitratireducens TaxID=2964666 RepID=UPI00223F5A36|nr:hypothetical protein [Sphingomicrobium nitratireducens]
MSKMVLLVAGTLGAVAATGLEAPASAQGRPVTEIVVFGEDPCPRSTDDEVVVCARKPESERFRIPETMRDTSNRQSNQSWAARATYLETVNETGIQKCSPVGEAGFTGCMEEMLNQARRERRALDKSETAPDL